MDGWMDGRTEGWTKNISDAVLLYIGDYEIPESHWTTYPTISIL